jgi:hypothetical protein
MTTRSTRTPFAVAILAAGVLLCCSSPEKELRKAKEAGTVAALDAFLAKHPDGPLAEQAKDAKEQLIFDAAKSKNTQAAYDEFLKTYPSGKLAPAARAAIDALQLAAAQRAGTIEAYEQFMASHRESPLLARASQALDKLLPAEPAARAVDIVSKDSAACGVLSAVTFIHRAGALSLDPPPEVTPGTMTCSGLTGATSALLEKTLRPDPNHTVFQVRSASTAGWGGCRSSCTIRYRLLGIEVPANVTYE